MDIVIDTSALLAVILAEPERDRVVELTLGHTLVGPESIPWEVVNAFSAMLKRKRCTLDEAERGVDIFMAISMRFVAVDWKNVLAIVEKTKIYAYDAYLLDCALRHGAPLLTLDGGLKNAAIALGLQVLET
jgi:predicted nucleic acid-binding protein